MSDFIPVSDSLKLNIKDNSAVITGIFLLLEQYIFLSTLLQYSLQLYKLFNVGRYWSITRAMDYLTNRTRTRVIIYIMAVWALR